MCRHNQPRAILLICHRWRCKGSNSYGVVIDSLRRFKREDELARPEPGILRWQLLGTEGGSLWELWIRKYTLAPSKPSYKVRSSPVLCRFGRSKVLGPTTDERVRSVRGASFVPSLHWRKFISPFLHRQPPSFFARLRSSVRICGVVSM